jgi:aminoglycoside phosphotransferase
MIPTDINFDVEHSTFFRHYNQLPLPAEVRSQAYAQYLAGSSWGDKRRDVSTTGYNQRPSPAVFESMGLFVKWGSEVSIAEGQCLYTIQHCFKDTVPVPEIYGWCTDGSQVFLYMKAISGRTLEQAWPEMEVNDCLRICRELRTIFDTLRQLKQYPSDTFVGEEASISLSSGISNRLH